MNMLIDGARSDRIPADDRGLLFGETVFETVAFKGGHAPLWSRHMARLAHGAKVLGLPVPSADVLASECQTLLAATTDESVVVRLTLTGGSGSRGYWPASAEQVRRIVQARPWPPDLEAQRRRGLRTAISRHRLSHAGVLAGLKHGNRLVQTLAAREAIAREMDDMLLLDEGGCLAEAISSNLILATPEGLLTPLGAAVAGVGLGWLRDQLGSELKEGSLRPERLERASEVLVVNSVAGVRPVVGVDQRRFQPGQVFQRLHSLWQSQLY